MFASKDEVQTLRKQLIELIDVVKLLNSTVADITSTQGNALIEALDIIEKLNNRITRLEGNHAAPISH